MGERSDQRQNILRNNIIYRKITTFTNTVILNMAEMKGDYEGQMVFGDW